MKKVIAFLLLLSLVFTFCPCGSATAQAASTASEDSIDYEAVYNEAARLYYIDHEYTAAFNMIKDMADCGYAPILRLLGSCWHFHCGISSEDIENSELYADLGGSIGRDINICNVKSLELIEKAVDGGDLLALCILGDIYNNECSVRLDTEKAEQLYSRFMETAESALDSSAPEYGAMLYNIGYSYLCGYGVEVDYALAMEYYEKGAELGYNECMNDIGYMYYAALGVKKDYAKAMEWFEKAANAGNLTSMQWIGDFYQYGIGVKKDHEKAMEWYMKGAEAGSGVCVSNVGFSYLQGYGVDKDYETALEWFKEAAETGLSVSMFNAGYVYYNHFKDYTNAARYFSMAYDKGYEDAAEYLKKSKIVAALAELQNEG